MMTECKAAALGKVNDHSDIASRFQKRYVNLLDPLDDLNNIGKGVNKQGVLEMKHAFASGTLAMNK